MSAARYESLLRHESQQVENAPNAGGYRRIFYRRRSLQALVSVDSRNVIDVLVRVYYGTASIARVIIGSNSLS